jgi:hypothetical protein
VDAADAEAEAPFAPDAEQSDPEQAGPERSQSLAATARAAIDAMRRGVIAYSAVAD